MPLVSKAQHRRFEQLVKEGKMTQAELDKWKRETPNLHTLPERVTPKRPVKNLDDLKARAKGRR